MNMKGTFAPELPNLSVCGGISKSSAAPPPHEIAHMGCSFRLIKYHLTFMSVQSNPDVFEKNVANEVV